LTISGSAIFKSDPKIEPPNYTLATLLRRTRYVECTGLATSTPSANC
jgi:hypothetical protein